MEKLGLGDHAQMKVGKLVTFVKAKTPLPLCQPCRVQNDLTEVRHSMVFRGTATRIEALFELSEWIIPLGSQSSIMVS